MIFNNTIASAGLKEGDSILLMRALWAFPEVEKLVLYGSRAKGRFDRLSDIDLALYGQDVTERIAARFKDVLVDGLNLGYEVDVVAPDHLPNPRLVEEIEKYGVVLYEKEA